MEIQCHIVGSWELLVSEINEIAQIYRFDDCRVHVVRGNQSITFDVPSTEWLERFTEVLKDRSASRYHETLRGSGYKLDLIKDQDGIDMSIYDLPSKEVELLHLSYEDAFTLHEAVLNCIIGPFLEQGGQLERLKDVQRFRL